MAVKNAVYALPAGPQAQEDFEWALKEIIAAGGEGMIVEARLIDGLSDEGVRALFNAAREADYRALAKDIRALEKDACAGPACAVARRGGADHRDRLLRRQRTRGRGGAAGRAVDDRRSLRPGGHGRWCPGPATSG